MPIRPEQQGVIDHHDARNDFVTDVDGYVYFWPSGSGGHYAAWHLRTIADELDRRNKAWNDLVQSDPCNGLLQAPTSAADQDP